MTDTGLYIQRLLEATPLRESVLRSIIRSLHLPPKSHGLDVGCGIGLQTRLLADAAWAKGGKVTGVDIEPEMIQYGQKIVEEAGLSGRITLHQGDMLSLPFEDHTFDWVWSADCVGYPAGELKPVLTEILRVVKPGGSVAILAWSAQQVLPGYPLLEARLNATCSSYMPYLKEMSPEHHFMNALHWFKEAGLRDVQAQTFVSNVQAPFREGERTALASLLTMLWGQQQPEVSSEDWVEFQRLCTPESKDFILGNPDYYAFFTYTMFRGRAPNLQSQF
jgi:ubiquinone/menaquinone biosynthesis C-methylase UbiE